MKYYIRLMRPTFQRAILTVEAPSEDAALQSALEEAGQLTEEDWARQTVREPPVIEILLSEEETEGDSEEGIQGFMHDVQHAYALLQADLESGEGSFIAPIWLKQQPELMVADLTRDWAADLQEVAEVDTEEFYSWLARQNHPANVVDFFAERDDGQGLEPDDDE